MWYILMHQKHIKLKKKKKKKTLQTFYRLRNIFNCVLPHWRHLTAGLLYNDFDGSYWLLSKMLRKQIPICGMCVNDLYNTTQQAFSFYSF